MQWSWDPQNRKSESKPITKYTTDQAGSTAERLPGATPWAAV